MAKHLCVDVRPEGDNRSFLPRDMGVWGILDLWSSFHLSGCSPSSSEVSRDLKEEVDAVAMFSYNTQCPTGLPMV